MSSGPLLNNLGVFQRLLAKIKYPHTVNMDSVLSGSPAAYLTIFHYIFLKYSTKFASFLNERNYELYSKSDERFLETVYSLARDIFSYNPRLSVAQFFQPGYTNAKLELAKDIITASLAKCSELEFGSSNKRLHGRSVSAITKRAQSTLKQHAQEQPTQKDQPESTSKTQASNANRGSSKTPSGTRRVSTTFGQSSTSRSVSWADQANVKAKRPHTSSVSASRRGQTSTSSSQVPAPQRQRQSDRHRNSTAEKFFSNSHVDKQVDYESIPAPRQPPIPTPAPLPPSNPPQAVDAKGSVAITGEHLRGHTQFSALSIYDAPPPGVVPISQVGRLASQYAQPPGPPKVGDSKTPKLYEPGISNLSSATADRITWTKSTMVPFGVPVGQGLDPYLLPYDAHLNEVSQRTTMLAAKYLNAGTFSSHVDNVGGHKTSQFEWNMIQTPVTGEWSGKGYAGSDRGFTQRDLAAANASSVETFQPFTNYMQAQFAHEKMSLTSGEPQDYQGPPIAETHPISSLARAGNDTHLAAPGSELQQRKYQLNDHSSSVTFGINPASSQSQVPIKGASSSLVQTKPTKGTSEAYDDQMKRCEDLRNLPFEPMGPVVQQTASQPSTARSYQQIANQQNKLVSLPQPEQTATTSLSSPASTVFGSDSSLTKVLTDVCDRLAALGTVVQTLEKRSVNVEAGLMRVAAQVFTSKGPEMHVSQVQEAQDTLSQHENTPLQRELTDQSYGREEKPETNFVSDEIHQNESTWPRQAQQEYDMESVDDPKEHISFDYSSEVKGKANASPTKKADCLLDAPTLTVSKSAEGTVGVEAITDKQVLDALILARHAEVTKTRRETEAGSTSGIAQTQDEKAKQKTRRATASVVAAASAIELLQSSKPTAIRPQSPVSGDDAYITPHSPVHKPITVPPHVQMLGFDNSFVDEQNANAQISKQGSSASALPKFEAQETLGSSFQRKCVEDHSKDEYQTQTPLKTPTKKAKTKEAEEAPLRPATVTSSKTLPSKSSTQDLIASLRSRIRAASLYLDES